MMAIHTLGNAAMKIALKDGAPRTNAESTVNVSKNANTIEISAADDQADSPPVVIEFYDGKLRLRHYDPKGKVAYTAEIPHSVAAHPAAAASKPALVSKPVETGVPVSAAAPAQADNDDEVAAFDAA
jgi:hypothetical protein